MPVVVVMVMPAPAVLMPVVVVMVMPAPAVLLLLHYFVVTSPCRLLLGASRIAACRGGV